MKRGKTLPPVPIPLRHDPRPGEDRSLSQRIARLVDTLVIALVLLDGITFLAGHGEGGTAPIELATAALLVAFALLVHLWLRQSSPGLDRAGQEDALLRSDRTPFPASARAHPDQRPTAADPQRAPDLGRDPAARSSSDPLAKGLTDPASKHVANQWPEGRKRPADPSETAPAGTRSPRRRP